MACSTAGTTQSGHLEAQHGSYSGSQEIVLVDSPRFDPKLVKNIKVSRAYDSHHLASTLVQPQWDMAMAAHCNTPNVSKLGPPLLR